MKLADAKRLAEAIHAELLPGCVRLSVAGSVRRGKPECKDIELVGVPSFQGDLFGGPAESQLDPILATLVEAKRFKRIKGGPKYKQYEVTKAGIRLDLFLAAADNFGLIYLIRTGPADYSHRLVTPRQQGGLMPAGWRVAEGQLWSGEVAVPTPEEQSVYDALGLPFVAPEDRA